MIQDSKSISRYVKLPNDDNSRQSSKIRKHKRKEVRTFPAMNRPPIFIPSGGVTRVGPFDATGRIRSANVGLK